MEGSKMELVQEVEKDMVRVRTKEIVGYSEKTFTTTTKEILDSSNESSAAASTISLKDDQEENNPFITPEKVGIHGIRSFRYRIFYIYRRIFSVVFIANIITLCIIFTSPRLRRLEYVATSIASNLAASVLFRQDHVVNLLFTVFCSVPVTFPLFIRRYAAKIYHLGGFHSGFAVASTIWLIAFTVLASIERASVAVLVITYILDCLLLTMIIFAHPTFRTKFHDYFELVHRFAGWTALALFWVQTIIFANSTKTPSKSLAHILLRTPNIWLLTVATFSVALPWMYLKKVPVKAEVLSEHAIRLHFSYRTAVSGSAVRLSERPLLQWHAFATIHKPILPFSSPNENPDFARNDGLGFSCVISNAGDWTRRQISRAPTSIWIRGVPTCGVMRVAPLFRSIVLIATGSGIGPCLPLIYRTALKHARPELGIKSPKLRIIWSTPNPLQTFGQEIIDGIHFADRRAIVHDTRVKGRPDLVNMALGLFDEGEREGGVDGRPEALIIIANEKVTRLVVYGAESRGVPGFGAIWDS